MSGTRVLGECHLRQGRLRIFKAEQTVARNTVYAESLVDRRHVPLLEARFAPS